MSVVEPDSPARNTRSRTRARGESEDNVHPPPVTNNSNPIKKSDKGTTTSEQTLRIIAAFMILTNIHQVFIVILPSLVPSLARMTSPIPRIAAGACFFYWVVAESVFRTKKGKNQISGGANAQDGGTSFYCGLGLISLQTLPLILLWIQGSGDSIQPLPFTFKQFHTHLAWYGVPLLLTFSALALRWLSISTLGDFFSRSLTVFDEHRIVDTGIYSKIRHPGYLANLLLLVGSGVAISGNLVVLIIVIIGYSRVWHFRISVEENMLIAAKKQAYKDYQTRVPYRLIPGIY